MSSSINVDLHGKPHSDFDLRRIARAEAQGFGVPVTAYLTSVFFKGQTCVGVVFGHESHDPVGMMADGRVIQTSEISLVQKVGRFWVLTTVTGQRYVLATFRREGGRKSFLDLLQTGQKH